MPLNLDGVVAFCYAVDVVIFQCCFCTEHETVCTESFEEVTESV